MSSRIPNSLEELPVSEIRWIGKGVERLEDPSLVTGRTEFIDNVVLPGMLHCAILRSPLAHAKIETTMLYVHMAGKIKDEGMERIRFGG